MMNSLDEQKQIKTLTNNDKKTTHLFSLLSIRPLFHFISLQLLWYFLKNETNFSSKKEKIVSIIFQVSILLATIGTLVYTSIKLLGCIAKRSSKYIDILICGIQTIFLFGTLYWIIEATDTQSEVIDYSTLRFGLVCLSGLKLIAVQRFDWVNQANFLAFGLFSIIQNWIDGWLALILFITDIPFLIGLVCIYIDTYKNTPRKIPKKGKTIFEKNPKNLKMNNNQSPDKSTNIKAPPMDIGHLFGQKKDLVSEDHSICEEETSSKNPKKTQMLKINSLATPLDSRFLEQLNINSYSQANSINNKNHSNKLIFTQAVSKVNALNSQWFQRLMKKYMRSLDQCMFIFDEDQRLTFNNHDERVYNNVLGKYKQLLNQTLLGSIGLQTRWNNVFLDPEKYDLKVQPETLSNLSKMMDYLMKNGHEFRSPDLEKVRENILDYLNKNNKRRTSIRNNITGVTQKSFEMNSMLSSQGGPSIIVNFL